MRGRTLVLMVLGAVVAAPVICWLLVAHTLIFAVVGGAACVGALFAVAWSVLPHTPLSQRIGVPVRSGALVSARVDGREVEKVEIVQ